eukprot:scaffold4097_cov166-Amphora_coffeaeformis.AAC.8
MAENSSVLHRSNIFKGEYHTTPTRREVIIRCASARVNRFSFVAVRTSGAGETHKTAEFYY